MPALTKLLSDTDRGVRQVRPWPWVRLDPPQDRPTALTKMLDDDVPTLACLLRMRWARSDRRPSRRFRVTKMFSDQERANRESAAFALGEIGPEAKAVAPALIERLQDDDGAVIYAALTALTQINTEFKPSVPVLRHMLKQGNYHVRLYAVPAGKIGPAAKEAVPISSKCCKCPLAVPMPSLPYARSVQPPERPCRRWSLS